MKTMNCTDETPCGEVVRTADGEDVILLRDGHPIALVIPFGDDDLEWYGRERDPAFLASIARARQQVRAGQTTSHEALKCQLGLG